MNRALFEYRLRESSRARHVRLRVTPEQGLEVVVPEGYNGAADIPRLLEHKRRWIHAALERAQINRKFLDPEAAWRVPGQIALPALGKSWEVRTRETNAAGARLRAIGIDCLELSGRINDERACRATLGRWLVRQAREHLVPRLQVLGKQTGLRHRHVYLRRQKTRWASCSRHKAISLNVKLLFLTPELVEYVLLHELCHTVELNHSIRFWALVQRHCPGYRQRDAMLREMGQWVPRWAR